jgi:hypothetical protein
LPTSGGATSAEANQEASRSGEVHFPSLPLCVFLDPRGPSRSLRNSSSQRAIKNSSNLTQPFERRGRVVLRTPRSAGPGYRGSSAGGNGWKRLLAKEGGKRKEPPGNRAALSLGRIVPTEAKPSELSGCIVGWGGQGVKNKSETKYLHYFL